MTNTPLVQVVKPLWAFGCERSELWTRSIDAQRTFRVFPIILFQPSDDGPFGLCPDNGLGGSKLAKRRGSATAQVVEQHDVGMEEGQFSTKFIDHRNK